MNTCNRRILIIDDNAAIHQDFRKIFAASASATLAINGVEDALFPNPTPTGPARPDFQLDSAYQGQQGLALVVRAVAEGRPYGMAFVDVRMPPGWDGIETTAHLWKAYPDLQIVLCTAYSDYSLNEMLAKLGQSDRLVILKKPFDNIEVVQLAIALTEKWQLLQQSRAKLSDLERLVQERTRELEGSNAKLRQEVAEHHRSALALQAAQEKLGHLLASSPVVIYSFKVEGTHFIPSWISDNLTLILGYSLEEWRQPDWQNSWFSTEDQPQEAASRARLLEYGHSSHESRLRRKDGSLRWLRNDRKLLRDATGAPIQVVGAYTDVTERRLLEDQLRQSQKMEAIGQLAGGIAHDFNNLLTVIGGYTQMLLTGDGVAARHTDALTRIAWAADRAGDLTRRLLTYGRKQVMQPTQLNVAELINEIAKMLNRLLGEHITLKLDCAEASLTLIADSTMMEQIIMNLAVNARDAMRSGGTLTIKTEAIEASPAQLRGKDGVLPGRFIQLTISDTGCGIAPEVLPRIFEPFFTTKDVGQGTGLGLATVDGIVKSHHGWIEVESVASGAGQPASGAECASSEAERQDSAAEPANSASEHENSRSERQRSDAELAPDASDCASSDSERRRSASECSCSDARRNGSDAGRNSSVATLPYASHQTPRPATGTVFKIFLPASPSVKFQVAPVVAKPQPVRRTETILLVEDEASLRRLGRTILEKRGHRVLEAASGVEALVVWQDNRSKIDLLFTDMVMPGGVTGGKLAALLQADKPGLKVLFTSGYSTELLEDDCVLRAGMNFLAKPFNPQSLLAAVSRCFEDQNPPAPSPLPTEAASIPASQPLMESLAAPAL